ncbi:MAG: glycosyltransferase [Helicobacteraceae bacterium]|nr:glycosyltransferase [Helicobacteraceae bacterium]
MNLKLKIKLFLKSIFNKIFTNPTLKNKILRLLGRDYELDGRELANIKLESLENNEAVKNSNIGDFIVSLTTFPARIGILKYTLYSIIIQNLRPKEIVLCLSKKEFENFEIPQEILNLNKFGLKILWSDEDLRQYNKIIPILEHYKDEVIITIDDDMFYPQNLLKNLYEAHLNNKKTIWCQRARVLKYSNTKIESFSTWKLVKKNNSSLQNFPQFSLFLEGVGGVLYPPNSLHKNVLNRDKFLSLSPKADDIWLWAMAVLNGSKIGVVKNNSMANGNAMTNSPYGQSLWYENLISGNDKQLNAVIKAYPQILEILNKKEMRILQLGKFYPPDIGGIESVMEDITVSLNKKGIICDVLCSNSKLEYKQDLINGAKIMRCASFGRLASTSIAPQMIFKLIKIIKDYEIIHIHLPDPMANLALLLSNYKNKKIILHWHSDIIKQKNLLKLYLPLQNKLLNIADKIIVTSTKYIEESSFLPKYKNKCVAIPIGFNQDAFFNSKEVANNIFPKDKKIIFSLGRFAKNKGFEYLIQSAKYLSDEYMIVIGGGGNEALKKEYLSLIKTNNLKQKVRLSGQMERSLLKNYYANCHIFALPSIQESYGIVLIEAMSFKKPIICTKLKPSGVDFINQNEFSGIVVEPKNPKALAQAVAKIEQNYNYYAQNAYNRYLEHFTLDKMIEGILNLYNNVLES